MSLMSPAVHPLDIPTTLSRSSRNYDDYSPCQSPTHDYVFNGCSPVMGPPSPVSSLQVVPDPGSRVVLEKTELVYDQLLADKQRKLRRRIDDKKAQLEEKIEELNSTNVQKAAEFKRWADAALMHLENQCANEMRRVREDYEMKFARLERSLADQRHNTVSSSSSASWSSSPSPTPN